MKTLSVHVRILDEGEVDQSTEQFFFRDLSTEDTSTLAELLHELHSKLGLTDAVLHVLSVNVRYGETEPGHSVWLGETVTDAATYDFVLAVNDGDDDEAVPITNAGTADEAGLRPRNSQKLTKKWRKDIIRAGSKLIAAGKDFAAEVSDFCSSTNEKTIKIVEVETTAVEDSQLLMFDEAALKQVLLADGSLFGLPVSIVSIAGAYRSGKSFLMNFCLRYLQHREMIEAGQLPPDADWFEPTDADDEHHHRNFTWRPGVEGVTKGIHVWHRPFVLKRPQGDKIAVLLLDTQGTEDMRSRDVDFLTVFALSTILSSCQVYNVNYLHTIQKITWERLYQFTQFASKRQELPEQNANVSSTFQNMLFLIRDAPDDYGFESGDRMVDALLKNGLLEDPQAGEDIRACFDKVRGFNMPHPGEEIGRGFRGARASYRAIVQAMIPSFKQYVKEFVETLLSPGSLPAKKVNGKTLTCGGLLHLFREYSKAFQSGKLPKPTTFSEANMRVTNTDAVERAREEYLARMHEWFRNSDRCPPFKASELECFHRSAVGKSKDVFQRDSCGAARHKESYLVQLGDSIEARIANEFDAFKQQNVDQAIPCCLSIYVQKWDDVVRVDKNGRSRLDYTKQRVQAIHDDALQLAVQEFKAFAASFPAHYHEGLKRLEQQTKIAFMKRKTKNATEAYTHAMAAERDKLTYWTNARLDESHRKAAAVATDVADLDISDDDGKIFSWDLKQNLKVMKTKFIPRDMPRGNGLAVDAGIGCYIEQMRRSIVLYETPYVESSNFVDKTDAARDLALEIFNDHCSQDGSSYLFKENLLKEIKRERTKFEKINRQNLWLQYLRRAGAFFNGLIGHFIPWFRAQPSSSAPPFYRGSSGISMQIPGGTASRIPLLPADDGPKITEVP